MLGLPLPKAAPVHQKPALTAKEVLTARAQARSQGKPAKPANKEEAVTSKKVTFSQADLSAGWDDATEALRGAGEHASDLVEAWIVANNGAAVAAAAEADHQFANARKAAKRGLNVLKARGVAIPSRPHVAKLADDRAEVSIEATLIPPDSTGTVAIAIATRDASGRYRIAEAIVRENVGVLQAGGGWLSGSSLKEARARAEGSIGVAPVHVPVEWARHRVAEARKQNAASGQVIPLGYERCRELFEPAPEGAPAHPAADLERDLTSETAWAMAPGSLALHEEPEFRGWLPDRRAIDEMLRKVGESLGADGVKDNQKVTDALLAEANAATDRFFGPEVRNVIADRMRDCAISIRARKGNDKASEVLAVAKAIREAGLITSPPNQIPFLVAFFQKAIGLMAQQSGGSLRIPIPQQTAQAAT